MIKTHPILFSAHMIRALLDGRKTQTRRIVKYQPDEVLREWRYCPYGYAKDLLWVREAFCKVDDSKYADDGTIWYDYRATPRYAESHPAGWENAPEAPEALKWKPSIHMPRVASRLTLEITNMRVEQLQDISEYDAVEEGINYRCSNCGYTHRDARIHLDHKRCGVPMPQAYLMYKGIWESINGAGSWDANPLVWVIGFDVHQQNIDALLKARAA